MSTFTASELTSPGKVLHAGLVSKSGVLTVGATGTASSIFMLASIPNGATVVDWVWYVDDAGDNQTWQLGIRWPEGTSSYTTSPSALSAAQSISSAVPAGRIFPQGNVPYKFSFSQGHRESYGWIVAENSAAISASAVHRFTLVYTMDNS